MLRTATLLLLMFILLFTASLLLIRLTPPLTYEEIISPDLSGVNPDELRKHLETLVSFNSRFIGHKGCIQAALYIASVFKRNGLEVYLDNFSFGRFKGVNVIGVKRGGNLGNMWVILCAHYDSFSTGRLAPGADDNGTGVSILLWLSGKLANVSVNKTVILIAFSGEEVGLAGSKHYVEKNLKELIYHKAVVINIDAVGYDEYLWVTTGLSPISPESRKLAELMFRVAEEIGVPILRANYILASDHLSFKHHGIPSVALTESILNPYIHSVEDTLDKVNIVTVCKAAKLVWETLRKLCASEEPVPCQL